MSTLYEVHTLKGGNWMIDSTYPEREKAIETAKQLYAEKQFEGVKVIKDNYDSVANQSKEIVIYDTTRPVTDRRGAPPKAEVRPVASAKKDVDFKGKKHHSAAKAEMSIFLRAMLWLFVILVAGIGIIWLLFTFTDFLAGVGVVR
ncbi:MAG: hypothetical protein KJ904_07300 [Alphaproteobacteria bacterium]|nr:hypothetical protein [Alphaproteobacteria bacterium]MBU0795917.1 hypothetical protein [Alphaproteobacteria bacterium]MBU0886954.1 hypothetical protein [Alphaproteobacteria bacterium]MBU1813190.1 hypothetical protein [Alphaproteobacteria bacterium]MBU2090756.1 hypothetical protein [Alphaproteobacteria bacterium]